MESTKVKIQNPGESKEEDKKVHKKMCKDDFETIKVYGEGAFAKVYCVKQKSNGEKYAMKVVSKHHMKKVLKSNICRKKKNMK